MNSIYRQNIELILSSIINNEKKNSQLIVVSISTMLIGVLFVLMCFFFLTQYNCSVANYQKHFVLITKTQYVYGL